MGYVEIGGRILGADADTHAKFKAIAQELSAVTRSRPGTAQCTRGADTLTLDCDRYSILVGHNDTHVVVSVLWPGMSSRVGLIGVTTPAHVAAEAIARLVEPGEVRGRLLLEKDKEAYRAFNQRVRVSAA